MRIYISGPITGHTDYMERFDKAEDYLRELYEEAQIVNPATVNSFLPRLTHAEYMKISLEELELCTHIYLMPGWHRSAGCCMEWGYAKARGIEILPVSAKE